MTKTISLEEKKKIRIRLYKLEDSYRDKQCIRCKYFEGTEVEALLEDPNTYIEDLVFASQGMEYHGDTPDPEEAKQFVCTKGRVMFLPNRCELYLGKKRSWLDHTYIDED